MSKTYAI